MLNKQAHIKKNRNKLIKAKIIQINIMYKKELGNAQINNIKHPKDNITINKNANIK